MPDEKEQPKRMKKYTEDEVAELVARASAEAAQKAVAEYMASTKPTVVQVNTKEEMVTLLYLGAVADGTVVSLGKLGQINGSGKVRDIPKKAFLENMDAAIEKRLRNRKLIVVNGFTDEERERFGVLYKEGELLSLEVFYKLLDYKRSEIVAIFKRLCETHQRCVAKMYISAYEKGDNRVNQETVTELNEVSKHNDPDGMFTSILKEMGRKLSE